MALTSQWCQALFPKKWKLESKLGLEVSLDGRQGRGNSAETQTSESIHRSSVWLH